MGRRKNNNPQKVGTRGPGRKSRKQQPPDGLDNDNGGGIALGVHDGSGSHLSPPMRSFGREAKLRAQSKLNTRSGVAALARKTKHLALTPPEVIVKPHEGEPLKSALKHTPSPKGTVSTTISKLQRQRSHSASKSLASSAEAARKVKFSDAPDVREMTLSETEEDRQPLHSTLMSILNSCLEAELGEPPGGKQKRRKKKAVLSNKKGQKAAKSKSKVVATDISEAATPNDDDEEDEDDGYEIDVPVHTPIELLHALVDMANAQQAQGPGSAENAGEEEEEEQLGGDGVWNPAGDGPATKGDFAKAMIELLRKQKKISPMKSKKVRNSDTGAASTSTNPEDDEEDTDRQPPVLLNDADVGEIEKLNEQAVTAAAVSPKLQRTSRSSPLSASSSKSSDLSVLLSDAAIGDDDTSSDEDFEPTAADFEQARRDALWKPGVDDDDTMEGAEDADAQAKNSAPILKPPKGSAVTTTPPSLTKTSGIKRSPAKKAPLENEAAAEDDDMTGVDGKMPTTPASATVSTTSAKSSPVKGRRSINAAIEQQQRKTDETSSTNAEPPSAPLVVAAEKEDDLIVSTTQGPAAAASAPTRTNIFPQSSTAHDPMPNRVPEQLAIVENRIHETIQTLATFDQYQKTQKDAGESPRPRPHFVDQLIEDLCTYYSYNEFLMRKLVDLFQFGELVEFCEANEAPRPVTIRVNSLKARRKTLAESLIQRGVNLDPIPGEWTKVGLVIYDSKVPIGATPEYLAGHYMLQGASSLLPVMAMAPKPGESILDMCAAPGGKSTHIAAVMKNTGMLVANDANRSRCKAIVANMSRMGVVNAVTSTVDGRKLPEAQQKYHRVLLDAPCSGTGVLARDPSAKMSKNEQDMLKITTLQKELILAAIRCLKPDGVLVYSTCSVLVEENESVVQYALNKCAGLKLVETGITFGVDGFGRFREHRFDAHMKYSKRFYPHSHNMDGFFVAKMRLCGPAKFNTDVDAATRSTVPEFGQQRGPFRFVGSGQDEDVEMADDDDDDEDGGERKMRSASRPAYKVVAGSGTASAKRRALREGARDRKKRKFGSNQKGSRNMATTSITGDKQRELHRSDQPSTILNDINARTVPSTDVAGNAGDSSLVPKNINSLPNGSAHHVVKPSTPAKQTSSAGSAEVTKLATQATRKEPAQLFQRVKNRAAMRSGDTVKPVQGVAGFGHQKSPLVANDGAVGARLPGKNSHKTIAKKRG